MKSLSNHISYDKKIIAQRESEIEDLQDEALDLYSQARDDHHIRQKIEEEVVVLQAANEQISDILKDRSARYIESLNKNKSKYQEEMKQANEKHERYEEKAVTEVESLKAQEEVNARLPNELVDYIGEFVGITVERDPPKRVGDLAFDKTHAV